MKVSKVCFVVSNNNQELQQKGNREIVGHGGESHGSQKDFGSQENQDHQWLGHGSNQSGFQGQPFGVPDAYDSGDNRSQSHECNDSKDDCKLISGHKSLESGFHKDANPCVLDTDNQEGNYSDGGWHMFNDGFPCTHRVLDSGHCNGIISGSLNIVVQLTILLGQNSSIKFILPGVEGSVELFQFFATSLLFNGQPDTLKACEMNGEEGSHCPEENRRIGLFQVDFHGIFAGEVVNSNGNLDNKL